VNAIARVDEPARHRSTHLADADEPDFLCHDGFP
jgi:hypothetical protein